MSAYLPPRSSESSSLLGLGWLGEPVVAAILERSPRRFYSSDVSAFNFIYHRFRPRYHFLHIVLRQQAPKLVGFKLVERVAMATAPLAIFIAKLAIHAFD